CITANSFSSISLDPALVMWAPGKSSRRFPLFRDAEHYAIHVLAAEQESLCWASSRDAYALKDMAHFTNEAGVPLIPDCLARFECTRVACHEAGDHMIVVGQVDRAEMRDGDALAFYAGKFGQFAHS
ncbi:MAG: flavin reductase family protein, partial [Pseudomonadota bacterium]